MSPDDLESKLLLAGFLGGGVALGANTEAMTFTRAVVAMITATATAFYFTPPLCIYFHLSNDYVGAIGFLLGLLALKIIPSLLKAGDNFLENPLRFLGFITKILEVIATLTKK